MAVYTDVDLETLKHFLSDHYELGELIDTRGIKEGIENTNYELQTTNGKYILTIFERRTPTNDLPFFLTLMEHLAEKNFPCPRPIKNRNKKYLSTIQNKKATVVTFIKGQSSKTPTQTQCLEVGKIMAQLHMATKDFSTTRLNPLGLSGCLDIFRTIKEDADNYWKGFSDTIETEFSFQFEKELQELPKGIIHADLFPDNIHFTGNRLSGVIDFYFSCHDILALDIAVTANSWCFNDRHQFEANKLEMILHGYESIRPLQEKERKFLPVLFRRTALRFLLTRAQDFIFPPKGILGIIKDPMDYMKILHFHKNKNHISDYLN